MLTLHASAAKAGPHCASRCLAHFPGASPPPRVHISPSKSSQEPADTHLLFVITKQIKCLAGKVGKTRLALTIPWCAPSSFHRLRLRAGLPTSQATWSRPTQTVTRFTNDMDSETTELLKVYAGFNSCNWSVPYKKLCMVSSGTTSDLPRKSKTTK